MEWVAGPFRGYLRSLVLDHLSRFITNIDIKHVGVASDVKLHDVELNVAALNEVRCRLRFARSFAFASPRPGAAGLASTVCTSTVPKGSRRVLEDRHPLAVAIQ